MPTLLELLQMLLGNCLKAWQKSNGPKSTLFVPGRSKLHSQEASLHWLHRKGKHINGSMTLSKVIKVSRYLLSHFWIFYITIFVSQLKQELYKQSFGNILPSWHSPTHVLGFEFVCLCPFPSFLLIVIICMVCVWWWVRASSFAGCSEYWFTTTDGNKTNSGLGGLSKVASYWYGSGWIRPNRKTQTQISEWEFFQWFPKLAGFSSLTNHDEPTISLVCAHLYSPLDEWDINVTNN